MQKKLWNKNFIVLLQASAVSTIGDLMYSVAIGYWVYEKTGSSGLMGVMSALSMFVTMVLSPFSGSVVDKLNRKWMMVVMDAFQGLLMLGVGILAYTDQLNVPVVIIAALLAAFGGVFYSPAARTIMIDIIPRDDMVRGQSLFTGTMTAIDMVGTAFSGVMVAFFGVPLIIVINGLSNLYSAFAELFIHAPKTVQEGSGVTVKGILHDSKDAVKAIFSDRCLKVLIPGVLVLNLLCAGPLRLMLPFSMEKGFTVDMYGYLLTVHTAASLLAVTVLGIVKLKPKARFWVMALGFSLAVVFLILSYLSRDFMAMCVLFFLASLLNTAGNAILNASLTLALPASNLGAILGFLQSASVGGVALSALLYGALGDVFPLYIVFAMGSAVSLAPMLYMSFHPDIKNFILNN